MDILDKFFNIIAPLECVVCDKEGGIICAPCFDAGLLEAQSACGWCGNLTLNFEVCKKCRNKILAQNVWWPFAYNETAKEIVSSYKFQSQRSVANFMAQEMLKPLPVQDFVVTSIPTATGRVRQRGFDHATRLGKKIATTRRVPYQKTLLRLSSSRQLGATRSIRIKQTENLFIAINHGSIKGQNILIVDDVMTTGATIASASKVLKRAGAKNVHALVFARK